MHLLLSDFRIIVSGMGYPLLKQKLQEDDGMIVGSIFHSVILLLLSLVLLVFMFG